ncbi:putative peptidylglycine alpha-hydroxylating monooxygenase 1 [Ciona intestinalis]
MVGLKAICILLIFCCHNCYGMFEELQASLLSALAYSDNFGRDGISASDDFFKAGIEDTAIKSEAKATEFEDNGGRSTSSSQSNGRIDITVKMPHVTVPKDDTYFCTKKLIPVGNYSTLYITGYTPHATQSVAHHMLLYACEIPGEENVQTWYCDGMAASSTTSGSLPHGSTCNSAATLVWAWAKDAPAFKLPNGVGFPVGPSTKLKYLVLQVHVKSMVKANAGGMENVWVTAHSTPVPQPKIAGIYVSASSYETIKPNKTRNWDIVCKYKGNIEMHPFAFRTHAHKLGVEVMGYRVRDEKWSLIGHKNPQLPEAFYNVKNKKLVIKRGDWLASRCVMHNFRNRVTKTGGKHTDEMCNFYMMYWTPRTKITQSLPTKECNNGYPWVHWRNYFTTLPKLPKY